MRCIHCGNDDHPSHQCSDMPPSPPISEQNKLAPNGQALRHALQATARLMRKAYESGGNRWMSIWEGDVQVVEAALAALSPTQAAESVREVTDEELADWVPHLDWSDGLTTADEIKQLRGLIRYAKLVRVAFSPTPIMQAAEKAAEKAAETVAVAEPCPYAEGQECILEINSIGPRLCANPVDPQWEAEIEDTKQTVAAEVAYFEAHADRFADAHKGLTAATEPTREEEIARIICRHDVPYNWQGKNREAWVEIQWKGYLPQANAIMAALVRRGS